MTPIVGLDAYEEAPPRSEILTCDDTTGLVQASAIDDPAIWREVVRLVPLPYGWEVDAQRCTNDSLRAHEKHQKQAARSDSAPLPEWTGAMEVAGIRVCVRYEGLAAHEGPPPPLFGFDLEHFSVPSRPGEVDCRVKCPSDQMKDIEAAFAQVAGKWFHPPDAVDVEVVRSRETIDPCTVLGTKLP